MHHNVVYQVEGNVSTFAYAGVFRLVMHVMICCNYKVETDNQGRMFSNMTYGCVTRHMFIDTTFSSIM